jgi:hypothetical protein
MLLSLADASRLTSFVLIGVGAACSTGGFAACFDDFLDDFVEVFAGAGAGAGVVAAGVTEGAGVVVVV